MVARANPATAVVIAMRELNLMVNTVLAHNRKSNGVEEEALTWGHEDYKGLPRFSFGIRMQKRFQF